MVFAFDQSGKLGARRYANLEENLAGPQSTNFIEVSGTGSWHGSPHNISTYLARFPVFGPFVQTWTSASTQLPAALRMSVFRLGHVSNRCRSGCGRLRGWCLRS